MFKLDTPSIVLNADISNISSFFSIDEECLEVMQQYTCKLRYSKTHQETKKEMQYGYRSVLWFFIDLYMVAIL